MKKLLSFTLFILCMSISCSKFDDSKIWDKLNDHEGRLVKLELLCDQMNTNISSLRTLVDALQKNEFVTAVMPVTDNGSEIGYVIAFSSGKSITIYHGKDGKDGENGQDGKDGYTPVIGVRADSDGIYYWTLDGGWMLDADGNKIPTTGKDGKDGEDGVTPQLKIEDDYWFVSYDHGNIWIKLGKATGEDGKDGQDAAPGVDGDSFFKTIDTSNDDYVTFILVDGTELKILRYPAEAVDVTLGEVTETSATFVGTLRRKPLDLKVTIYYSTDADLNVYENIGNVSLTSFPDETFSICIEDLMIATDYYYFVEIVADGVTSYSEVESLTTGEIPNNQIWYTSSDGNVVTPYVDLYFGSTIKSNTYNNGKGVIEFESEVKSIGSNAFRFRSSLTGITIPNSVTIIGSNAFYECSALVDVIIPESVTNINHSAFSRCSSLKNICIPYGVKRIEGDAFSQCSSLTDITIPESVKSIGSWAFYVCSSLAEIIIPDSVTNIGSNAFAHCKSLVSLVIPSSVAIIGEEVVRGCTSLSSIVVESGNQVYDSRNNCNAIIESASNTLVSGCQNSVIPDDVIKIDNDVFRDCNTLSYINIPASVTSIGDRAFSNCTSLSRVDVRATDPPTLGEYAFSTSDILTIYVPENRVTVYKAANGWKDLNIVAE